MKQKQLRRILKTKKKMENIKNGSLSNNQIINNFAYALETYKKLGAKYEKEK